MPIMNTIKDIERETQVKMDKTLDALRREFQAIRTGRASTAIVEGVMVDYYGTQTPLKGLANLSTPDPKTIAVQPWDPAAVQAVEKALQMADLGVSPVVDGKIIRVQVPPMTEDRRKELNKVVRKFAEEGRVSIRAARHEAIEATKQLEKDKVISEDESHSCQKRIQKVTDDHTKKVDELLKHKESELEEI